MLHTTRTLTVFAMILCLFSPAKAQQSDVIMQGFYWNTHPGNVTDPVNGGIWWDTLATVAPQLAGAGFRTVWMPPLTKGFSGLWDMGYGMKDYFDLGEFNQNGSIRTRHGTRIQLQNAITAIHNNGLLAMADVVLNHRGGGDGQAAYQYSPWSYPGGLPYTIFNPASGRFPGVPAHFHPNNYHPDQNPDYHNPIFFEDLCYFNGLDGTPPAGGWYFGAPTTPGMGVAGDSLIVWGRWLKSVVGFDEFRLDAVKHIDPYFLSKFLIESYNGDQPFAVGESFDYSTSALANYHGLVTGIGSNTGGVKAAKMSLFDFPLRGILRSICNDGSGGQNLYTSLGGTGLVWGTSLTGFDVVTWVENHDVDRIGFVGGSNTLPCPPGEITYGNTCLKLEGGAAADHQPIFTDKEDMAYPFIMAAEGRPSVFWKDFFWYGMADDITWQMALRRTQAQGASEHIANLNGFWPTNSPYDGDNNGGNMFAMRRSGLTSGVSDGMILGLNDHPTKTNAVFVNTPYSNRFVKDYSDAYLFQFQQVFADSRALIKAGPRDYSWWSLTGLYPTPPGETPSVFTMGAQPGGSIHFIALDLGDAANFQVNGAPIAAGDQIAILNTAGQVCGIGRIGQGFGWNGTHDMIIEVIGRFPTNANPTGGAANGMANNETFRLQVYDASAGLVYNASTVTFASTGTGFTFNPLRPNSPNRNGNFSSFPLTASNGSGFTHGGLSRITGFTANSVAFPVVWRSIDAQTEENDVLLTWTLSSEKNNQGFEVEMRNAEDPLGPWQRGAFVSSRGDSDGLSSYSYRLSDLEPGSYDFRLRQTDTDGNESHSPVVHALVRGSAFGVQISPNPVKDEIEISLSGYRSTELLSVSLSDVQGRVIWQQNEVLSGIQERLAQWNAQAAPGMYFLRVQYRGKVETVKIVRE